MGIKNEYLKKFILTKARDAGFELGITSQTLWPFIYGLIKLLDAIDKIVIIKRNVISIRDQLFSDVFFHERILNFPPCLVPSDDYLNGSKHSNFLFPHTFQTVWCNLFLVVSSWTHPTPYPSSRYWKSNKKKVKMGPKFDPTAITIGKIILTKKSLVIYTPPIRNVSTSMIR